MGAGLSCTVDPGRGLWSLQGAFLSTLWPGRLVMASCYQAQHLLRKETGTTLETAGKEVFFLWGQVTS